MFNAVRLLIEISFRQAFLEQLAAYTNGEKLVDVRTAYTTSSETIGD
jgi:hypothetical protein